MSFLEKHYPDVALSRNLLQNRLRQLQNRLQQRDRKIHLTHHIEIENNITDLYDILRKTAQKQTLMQTQINLLRNKSTEAISHEQFEHKQKLNQLKYAYKLAEDKAYLLKKRIQCNYPNSQTKCLYNQLKSPLEKLEKINGTSQLYSKLEQQAEEIKISKKQNNLLYQQESQLRELIKERQYINNLLTKQQNSSKSNYPQKYPIQTSLNRNNSYSDLQTAEFNRINQDLHKMNSELNRMYANYKIKQPIHQAIEYQTDRKKRNNQNIGKLYSRKQQNQTKIMNTNPNRIENETKPINSLKKQQQFDLKNQSIINKFNLLSQQKNALAQTKIKEGDSEEDSNQHQSKQLIKTKANNDVSYSISYPNFKPKFDEVLDKQSEESDNSTQSIINKTQNNKKVSNKSKHKRTNSYLSTMKRSISEKKKRDRNQDFNTINKNIFSRIQNRIDYCAVYEHTNFKNVKHQHDQLFNTYNLQSRLRQEICSKISKHHLAERKFGVI